MTPQPRKTIDLYFVYVEIFDDYLVSTIKEGVLFDKPELEAFYEIFDTFFPDSSFGYISNRKFDYTINPTCYLESSKYPGLLGMAIVCNTKQSYRTANFEKTFYDRPFHVFYKMEEAERWVAELLGSDVEKMQP